MKLYSMRHYVLMLGAGCMALAWAGCAQLDTTPPGRPDRVLAGTVNFNRVLPAGAEVFIRVVDPAATDAVRAPGGDLVIPGASVPRGERVLGEFRRVTESATPSPVPFQVEYSADDSALRRGLNVDVRIAFSGKVRLRTLSAHVVTLAASPFPQEVWVQPVE